MAPVKLIGLRPQAYEHPGDKSALDALQKTAGLGTVISKLSAWGFERTLRVQLTGSYLRATPDSFPELHGLLRTACDVLDLPLMPELYIAPGDINAFTAGIEHPFIVINAGAVDSLTPDEMLYVIGHEVGHIKSGHVLYYQIAEFLPVIGEIVGDATLGIGKLLTGGMQIALLSWKRTSEFTADRAGLLACQDGETALRALIKLSGLPHKCYNSLNTEDFIAQARAFQAMDSDKLTLVAKWLSAMGATHPWTVMRAQQILNWMDTGGYQQVLQSPQRVPSPRPPELPRFCGDCGATLRGPASFCPECGHSLNNGRPR